MINVDWVYVICSEKFEPERYKMWDEWLSDNDINGSIEFYKWGSELSESDINHYVVRDGTLEELYPWRTGYPIRPAEASVAISFIKIFEDAFMQNYNKILIFESDVILHPNFIEIMNSLLDATKEIDMDSFSFGYGMGMRLQDQGHVYVAQVDQFRCADSLLFSKKAIEYFYHNLKQIRLPIDEEFTQAVRNQNINTFWLEPPIAVQGSQLSGGGSSIQSGNPWNLTLPWLGKDLTINLT